MRLTPTTLFKIASALVLPTLTLLYLSPFYKFLPWTYLFITFIHYVGHTSMQFIHLLCLFIDVLWGQGLGSVLFPTAPQHLEQSLTHITKAS